jgi:hypothetical protein
MGDFGARADAEAELEVSGWRAVWRDIAQRLEKRAATGYQRYTYFRRLPLLLQKCGALALSEKQQEMVRAEEEYWNARRWECIEQQTRLEQSAAALAGIEQAAADRQETCRAQLVHHVGQINTNKRQQCLQKIAQLKLHLDATDLMWARQCQDWVVEWAERDALWARAHALHQLAWAKWLTTVLPALGPLPAWATDPLTALAILRPYGALACPPV